MKTLRFVVPILIASLAGCPITPETDRDEYDSTGVTIEEKSELFVESPLNITVFQTNDTGLQGPYGTTLWTSSGMSQDPLVSREVIARKITGDDDAGYGLVFCHYDTGDPAVGETMLVVMINTRCEYTVGEVIGAEFRAVVPWTGSAALSLGYNQNNTIRIEYDSVRGDFSLLLNGVAVTTFRDDEPPYHTGGADGFVVVISPLDEFPETPVHVEFQEI